MSSERADTPSLHPDGPAEWTVGRLAAWVLFAAAFGMVEATVVLYLRLLLRMPAGMDYHDVLALHGQRLTSGSVFGMMATHGVAGVEVCREAATILLLAGAAIAAGRSARERWALFGLSFAVWDLAYYAFLFAETGFPRGLAATDIYFLIPFAWYGPVWFPVLVVMPSIAAMSLRALAPAGRRRHVAKVAVERSES